MRYCFNPQCPHPRNPDEAKICYSCQTELLLAERYRGLKLIGEGGFGRTYLVEDESQATPTRLVIKQFYPQDSQNIAHASQLFAKEAQRLEQLGEHPQIPQFYQYLEQGNYQYIVQEFIDGQNLETELAENGVFREQDIRQLLEEVLPVLKFIHEGEVIHRDIKPANIIRCRHRQKCMIVDFGAAKYATSTMLKKTGTIIGSAEYIAPEQLRGKSIFASDIYSLGVTCLYLLTQVSPFNLFDIIEDDWVWRDYLVNNSVSDELATCLDKMVKNSLRQRYQCVNEILKDLKLPLSINFPAKEKSDQKPKINEKEEVLIERETNQEWQCQENLLGHTGAVNCVVFSPQGSIIASGGDDCQIKIWYAKTGQEIKTLHGHTDKITALAFSRDSRLLSSSSWDRLIQVWDWKKGEIVKTLIGHDNWINCLTFIDSHQIISGSYDRTIKIWNIRNGKIIQDLSILGYQSWVNSLDFSPVYNIYASGHWDNLIKIWDLNSPLAVNNLIGHANRINALLFSPDGQVLISGSKDKSIKFWDWSRERLINSLGGHLDAINALDLHPQGTILASASADQTIKLWELKPETWELVSSSSVITLIDHKSPVNSVKFSPDKKSLISSSQDGAIKVWRRLK